MELDPEQIRNSLASFCNKHSPYGFTLGLSPKC